MHVWWGKHAWTWGARCLLVLVLAEGGSYCTDRTVRREEDGHDVQHYAVHCALRYVVRLCYVLDGGAAQQRDLTEILMKHAMTRGVSSTKQSCSAALNCHGTCTVHARSMHGACTVHARCKHGTCTMHACCVAAASIYMHT